MLMPRGLVPRLLADARHQPRFDLTRPEPHPAGALLGLGGMLAGVWIYRSEGPWRDTLAAAALGVVLLGLVLHGLWRRPGTGWRVDVAARRLEPLGGRGEAVVLDGSGWSIATAPGERRSHVAIDLRHVDRGRVARLLDQPAYGSRPVQQISALADVLAKRLGVERTGPRA